MFTERRKHKRFPISDVVLFRLVEGGSGDNRYCRGQAQDISPGGLFFVTDEPLRQGDRIELAFRKRNEFADRRVRAKVVHVVHRTDGFGVGVRFAPSAVKANEPATGQGVVR